MATIILIGFSFLIGTVVMAWGEKYIEEKADFVATAQHAGEGCKDVFVHPYNLNGIDQACDKDGMFVGILENGPSMAVQNVQVKFIGSRNVQTIESVLPSPMQPSAVERIEVSHKDLGDLRQVKFTPKIMVDGRTVFCADKNTAISKFDCSWT